MCTMRMPVRDLRTRLARGAFILHSLGEVARNVPNTLAGAALSAFAGKLMTMYLRRPGLHKPHSVWPTPTGIGVSKDVWMLAIGRGLLADRGGESDR